MTEILSNNSSVNDVADLVKDLYEVEFQPLESEDGVRATIAVVPKGKELVNIKSIIDENRQAPERRKGSAAFFDVDSFVAHVNRFKDTDSIIFANNDRDNPSMTSVLNYHRAGATAKPQFGDHQGFYLFPFSDEWKAWTITNGKGMSQKEFAEFIEDRILDVIAVDPNMEDNPLQNLLDLLGGNFASPNKLVELSKGLAVNENSSVKNTQNISTGETQLQYVTEHSDSQGQPLSVPNLFMIGIPVFVNDTIYSIAVRLRYRIGGGKVTWFYEMYRTDKVFDDAFNGACTQVKEATDLPLLLGSPEA